MLYDLTFLLERMPSRRLKRCVCEETVMLYVPVQVGDQLIFVMAHSRSEVSNPSIGLLGPPEDGNKGTVLILTFSAEVYSKGPCFCLEVIFV